MSGARFTKKIASYQSYFDKVITKRLKYVNNINGLLSIIISITFNLPYGNFWWNILLTLIVRAPLIFIALSFVKLSRKYNTTVELSPYKTLGEHILKTLISKKAILNFVLYVISSLILSITFISQLSFKYDYYVLSKIYQQKPQINDEWVFYWFYSIYIGIIYTGQHLIFQRNKLNFKWGVNKIKPELVFFNKTTKLIGNSIGLNLIISLSGPIIYYLMRSIIYKLNFLLILIFGLDSSLPTFHISLHTLFDVSYLSFQIILSWEVVNHIYNIYLTIGCLDGRKPISTYSADPINTLLSGLRDINPDHQLSRLTAFQELAYISTSKTEEGTKLRFAIYNAHSKQGFIWPAILEECSLIIKETTSRVNYRTKQELEILKKNQIILKDDNLIKNDQEIFGNSFLLSPNSTYHSNNNNEGSRHDLKKYEDSTNVKSKNLFDVFLNSTIVKLFNDRILSPIKLIFINKQKNTSNETSAFNFIGILLINLKKIHETYRKTFLSTKLGSFFRITIERDSNSRIINPVNFGNSVISISNLLIHAIEEDKNNSINNQHISEIFNLLEKPIRSFSNYTDSLPSSIYINNLQQQNEMNLRQHLIAVLHDLTMTQFYTLCLKYNYKLNDLVLSARAFKLAKWVIDVAIAQQQQQHHHQQVENELKF